jgi:hypothetical protein
MCYSTQLFRCGVLASVVALCFSGVMAGQPQNATQPDGEIKWIDVGGTDAGNLRISVVSSATTGHTTQIRFRIVFRRDTPEGRSARETWTSKTTAALEDEKTAPVAATEVITEVDCRSGRFRYNGRQTLYDDDGQIIESVKGDGDAPWQEVSETPGWEMVLKAICGG